MSLLGGGPKLELVARSMRSLRGKDEVDRSSLLMPNGVDVAFTDMRSLSVKRLPDGGVRLQVIMLDSGIHESDIRAPVFSISGQTKVGIFKRTLDKIERIDFR